MGPLAVVIIDGNMTSIITMIIHQKPRTDTQKDQQQFFYHRRPCISLRSIKLYDRVLALEVYVNIGIYIYVLISKLLLYCEQGLEYALPHWIT